MVGRGDLHAVGAPAEGAGGRDVAAADDVDPKCLVDAGLGDGGRHGQVLVLDGLANDLHASLQMVDDQRRFHQCVVADDVYLPMAACWGQGQDGLKNQLQQERGVLSAGVGDDPRVTVFPLVFDCQNRPNLGEFGDGL